MSWQFDPRNSWSWLWFNQIKHREVEVERLQYYCTAVWSWECIETLLNEFKAYQAYDQVCQKDWHSPKIKKVHFNWGKHLYKQLFLWRINRKPWILSGARENSKNQAKELGGLQLNRCSKWTVRRNLQPKGSTVESPVTNDLPFT